MAVAVMHCKLAFAAAGVGIALLTGIVRAETSRYDALANSPLVENRPTILRLYSPTEAAIDKSWKPGDIEKTR
jgi:hypothetical protein